MKLVKNNSLPSEIAQIGKDYSEIIDTFGNHLYDIGDKKIKYGEIGDRLSKQRNDFAHGNLDNKIKEDAIIDLVFLEYIIYAMQLKRWDVPVINIRHVINDLFIHGPESLITDV